MQLEVFGEARSILSARLSLGIRSICRRRSVCPSAEFEGPINSLAPKVRLLKKVEAVRLFTFLARSSRCGRKLGEHCLWFQPVRCGIPHPVSNSKGHNKEHIDVEAHRQLQHRFFPDR